MTTLVKILLTFIVIFVVGGIGVALIKEAGGVGWPVAMIAVAMVFGIWKYKGNKK